MNMPRLQLSKLFLDKQFNGSIELRESLQVYDLFDMQGGTIYGTLLGGNLVISSPSAPGGANSKWGGGTLRGIIVDVVAPPLPDRGRLDVSGGSTNPTVLDHSLLTIESRSDVRWQAGDLFLRHGSQIENRGIFYAQTAATLDADPHSGFYNQNIFIQDGLGTVNMDV
jgi:hypothetical protein